MQSGVGGLHCMANDGPDKSMVEMDKCNEIRMGFGNVSKTIENELVQWMMRGL